MSLLRLTKLLELRDLPIEEYHPNGLISSSMIKFKLANDWRGFQRRYVTKDWPREEKEAFQIGQAVEDAACGRDTFIVRPKTITIPKKNPEEGEENQTEEVPLKFTTKEGKAWRAAHAGKLIIENKYESLFTTGLENLWNNSEASALIKAGIEQVTFQAQWGDDAGIQARPDWWIPEGSELTRFVPCAPDLKTTVRWGNWDRVIGDYGYHIQAALVRMTSPAESTSHPLIFLEKTEPHRVQVVWLKERWIELGIEQVHAFVDGWEKCMKSGVWPLVETESVDSDAPEWMLEKWRAINGL